MALKFISHKEISFRTLLGMLRTPPVAMMNYYTNLFLSARFVFGEQPDKIKFLDKEVRRVECMVGVELTPDSDAIQYELKELGQGKKELVAERMGIENVYEKIDEKDEDKQRKIEMIYGSVSQQIDEIDRKEYILLNKLTPLMNLKMIETYMDNNMDLKSFFKEGGRIVTQMELNADRKSVV